ncbi:3-hydroxyacyl-[acyl-carrier-protein] dehydratase [Streptococcus gallolyticus]|uniref:3-hydroxyacyl-[acyl-carrier-protein] dehydratase n=1 Tax=Streptococcus gallolyticus TaxID=315405 RepID=A0A1H7VXC6_9STRE|nr:3-hydroxyacyl-ACP dehydratase FabZ [Streptococcus gallolyticus]MCQ9216471.1 3-hydroxyacyl-ACP dehydratase FabZ [Streptococcus gallolyticus]MCY7172733.1 3-hydroxyacyl-ACP dehydratase FabZ [Streptococcus gallolyticus subsp. gallolyticus]MCY7188257.1 3-hydroxyacyl-ACP dehydratase FabZ [Streptococcus gallolyticus subsp. gallolyticus]SDK16552.1 3-hydroxyacyl-[acyl-carrier-protein] dehydratase [Streptococcus gallolyticus]SDL65785.1 3-hydroxyacyl-[acyl-carrier-protein] dehydratase [Streptococcus g
MVKTNSEDIIKMLPHRYPFLLVDKVLKYKTGVIECRKNITINEPFFQGHFPGRPIVPGVLMIEMAAQSAALLYILDSLEGKEVTSADLSVENVAEKVGYLASVKNFKFKKIATPGDQLTITCKSQSKLGQLLEIQAIIRDENKQEVASGRMLVSENGD